MNYFKIASILLFLSTKALASGVSYSDELSENINKNLTYIQSEKELTPEQAWAQVNNFKPITVDNLVLDFKETETWSFVKFLNGNSEGKKIHLSFAPAYLGSIYVYNRAGQLITETGSLKNVSNNQIFYSQTLPLDLIEGENEYLIKIKSLGSSISVHAYSNKEFEEKTKIYQIMFFLLIGAIGTLGLYQLFLFLTSKKIVYFYYVLYSLGLIGCQFTLTGYFHLLPKDILFG